MTDPNLLLSNVTDAILANHGLAGPSRTRDLAMPLAIKHARAAILATLDALAEVTSGMVEAGRCEAYHDGEPAGAIYAAMYSARRREIEQALAIGRGGDAVQS